MNRIRQEIRKSMVYLKNVSATETEAKFIFDEDFIGFKGHFPGRPVLPGVCKIQAALVIYEEKNNSQPQLKEIVSAKFFSPVSVNDELIFKYQEERLCQDVLVKVKVSVNNNKVAQIHLTVANGGKESLSVNV
ncbi:MAG: hypothetical protein KJ629_05295 [Candidatus Omnitrophica bacterium]|nr:hypothetical protein [Candidatus Omnitrophota bacterium]MBU1810541.1 hypothetical protein [Candidatus Omnitrophota bacterium]